MSLCAEQDPLDRHATVDRGRHGREEHRRVELFAVAGRLPPEWREVWRWWVQGEKREDMARKSGRSLRTIQYWMAEMLDQMREALGE